MSRASNAIRSTPLKRLERRVAFLEEYLKKRLEPKKFAPLNISPEAVEALRSAHNGVCDNEECSNPENAADHCHETGNFRGFLCVGCNIGLGAFNDDLDKLQSIARYLINARLNPHPPDLSFSSAKAEAKKKLSIEGIERRAKWENRVKEILAQNPGISAVQVHRLVGGNTQMLFAFVKRLRS